MCLSSMFSTQSRTGRALQWNLIHQNYFLFPRIHFFPKLNKARNVVQESDSTSLQATKENVQGSYYTKSTCLYSAIAKSNVIIKTKTLSIFWNYLSLICQTEILYIWLTYHWQFNSYFQVPWYYCMCNVQCCMQNVVSFHAALSTADCRELSWSCMSWWSRNIVYLKIFPFWNKTHCLSNVNLWKIICFAS